MSAFKDLQEEHNLKHALVDVKISAGTKEKIDFVVEHSGIKEEDWLGLILKKSEISKVYKDTKARVEKESI